MTNQQMDDKEGEYFDEKHYKHIIKSNCDCYREDDEGNQHLLATFRRSVLPDNPKGSLCAAFAFSSKCN